MTVRRNSLPNLVGNDSVEKVEVQTEYLDYDTSKYDHASEMVFTRQKSRANENPESPARTHPEKHIREGRNPRRPLFIQEQNDLFIQQVLQYSQENESDELHYHVLGLNKSSTEYDVKINLLFPGSLISPR